MTSTENIKIPEVVVVVVVVAVVMSGDPLVTEISAPVVAGPGTIPVVTKLVVI